MNEMTVENVKFDELIEGPIRHETLPCELVESIRVIHQILGRWLPDTLEEFETGFKRDAHPDVEVAMWSRISLAWIAYHVQYLGCKPLPDPEEEKLLASLIAISTGVDDVKNLIVRRHVGKRLLACYRNVGK